MSIGSICCREVVIAAPDESADDLARRMRDHNVGSLVVLNHSREPVGIVTDRDLVLRVLAEGLDPRRVPAQQLMTVVPQCADEYTPIESALHMMRATRCRRLPVVDTLGRLVGIVTLDDVIELLTEELVEIDAVIRSEAPYREERAR